MVKTYCKQGTKPTEEKDWGRPAKQSKSTALAKQSASKPSESKPKSEKHPSHRTRTKISGRGNEEQNSTENDNDEDDLMFMNLKMLSNKYS